MADGASDVASSAKVTTYMHLLAWSRTALGSGSCWYMLVYGSFALIILVFVLIKDT
jgi:hypothetical protein